MATISQNRNWIPAAVAFIPALLLPLTQEFLRPALRHSPLFGPALASAPNFIVGLCFPFSILIRPRSWTQRVADMLFVVWCCLTIAVLIAVEYFSPFGPNVFDPYDLLASAVGVALALAAYAFILRRRLAFGAPASAIEP
jgi:hypothetical protein